MILGIDPGNIESAYVIVDENLRPISFGKVKNDDLLDDLNMDRFHRMTMELKEEIIEHCAVEMIASYGMPVGKEVFETCVWIGRFIERVNIKNIKYIYRQDEKLNLCGTKQAKDSNVIQALIDRFASGVPNHGKGIVNKKIQQPGWFYGFSKDIWQAYAVAVTYHDMYQKYK